MTGKRRSGPSERQRALWALAGFIVPAVGDEGIYEDPSRASRATAKVRVTRVSATGKTIWVRFLPPNIHQGQDHAFYRRAADGLYCRGDRPYGELSFQWPLQS